jgi:hypothetical protein
MQPESCARWPPRARRDFRCRCVALGTGPGPVPLAPSDGGGFGNTESVPRRTVIGGGRSPAPGMGLSAVGTVAAYTAAIVAFAYALVSLYWAAGGRGLVGTVGGYVEQMARRGGAAVVLLAVVATAAKAVAGLIALALVRPWGRVLRRSWLLAVSAAASVLLIVYDGLNVAAGALVLSGVVHPSGSVDRMALRWHVGVWDLWFFVWGILLAVATVSYWRRNTSRRAG